MRITISNKLPRNRVNEGSACTLTASFFDDSTDTWAASAPTSAKYRIDRINGADPRAWYEVLGWTTLTPATSNSIAVTAAQNAILDTCSYSEKRQVTVKANDSLATQYEQTHLYTVVNLAGT